MLVLPTAPTRTNVMMTASWERPGLVETTKLAESCRTVTRHTTKSNPQGSRQTPKLPNSCPTVVGRLPQEPTFGQARPFWDRVCPIWATFSRSSASFGKQSIWANGWPMLANSLVEFGQFWPNSVNIWSNSAKLGPKFGPNRAAYCPTQVMMVEIWPILG